MSTVATKRMEFKQKYNSDYIVDIQWKHPCWFWRKSAVKDLIAVGEH